MPRTGLFARNHLSTLTQRNRVLQNQQNSNENLNEEVTNNVNDGQVHVKDDIKDNFSSNTVTITDGNLSHSKKHAQFNSTIYLFIYCIVIVVDSPNSSYASLPRDQEGFDDLDAYFNRANTPQKTPKALRKPLGTPSVVSNGNGNSISATPSTNRKTASVLLAKPLKMISSKIAEHYRKEPRLAVSLSEVLKEQEMRDEEVIYHDHDNGHHEYVLESEQSNEVEDDFKLTESVNVSGAEEEEGDDEEDRIQRAKRELEEMSISNSYDSYDNREYSEQDSKQEPEQDTVQYTVQDNDKDDQMYIRSGLNQSTTIQDDEGYDNQMPIDDDVLMDRLVEEMLVNDIEPTAESESFECARQEEASTVLNLKKKQQPKKPKALSSSGRRLERKPMTYYAGTEYSDEGVRRSCRMKMEPLRYWANEKVCYGRAEDPSITLPVIVNVIKKPELDDPTFTMGLTRKRRRPTATGDVNVNKLRAQAFGPDCDVEAEVACYERPGEEDVRLVALSHHHVQGDDVKDSTFKIHTIFTEGSYMSSGQLIFPPMSQKPTKNSSRHALVFYVISGSFRVEINRESFLIGPGGQFHVPRANPYTITHVSSGVVEGRLFFCHCKDNSE